MILEKILFEKEQFLPRETRKSLILHCNVMFGFYAKNFLKNLKEADCVMGCFVAKTMYNLNIEIQATFGSSRICMPWFLSCWHGKTTKVAF